VDDLLHRVEFFNAARLAAILLTENSDPARELGGAEIGVLRHDPNRDARVRRENAVSC
jgi:hypothetical protein